jgi:tetratricopeptide (TPR) repeat protein
MDTKTKQIIGVLALGIIAIGGAFAYQNYQKTHPKLSNTTGSDAGYPDARFEGIPEGATVQITDRLNAELFNKTPKPSLSRSLPQGSFTKEQYLIAVSNRKALVKAINDNPAAMANWLNLGILHKQAGDYEGARIYWSYVATVNPTNLSAHWDLATLYELYLKDLAKAEEEFNKVISLDTTYISAYLELSATYANSNDKNKAIETLTRGLLSNKNAIDLLIARGKLYRDMGNKAEAIKDYTAAIALAKTQKNDSLVATLTSEQSAIK